MIHHSVDYLVVDSSPNFIVPAIKHIAIEVDVGGGRLLVINVYIQAVSSVPSFTANLGLLFGIT